VIFTRYSRYIHAATIPHSVPAAQAHTTRLCAPRGCERAKRSCLLVLISKLSAAAPPCVAGATAAGGAGAVAAPGLRLFPDPGAWVLSRPRIIIADHADSVRSRGRVAVVRVSWWVGMVVRFVRACAPCVPVNVNTTDATTGATALLLPAQNPRVEIT